MFQDYDSDYDEPTPRHLHSETNGQVSLFHRVAPPANHRPALKPPLSPKINGIGPGGRRRKERDFNTVRISIHSQRKG